MKKFWQNICTGVIFLYILVVGIVFVPYYNWKYAKTHGFVKWVCFGEVVATAKAIVWPYHVFFSTSDNSYDSPDATHFSNSKKAFDEALIIVNEVGDVTKLPADLKVKFADLLRLAIAEAAQVQPMYLQEAHPDYPSMYENKYKYGISAMLQGIETDNTALVLEGTYAYNEFSDWIQEQKSDFSN